VIQARQELSTRITVGVGMQQCDLASATADASREGSRDCSEAPIGSSLIEAYAASRERSALAALLPEFRINQNAPRSGERLLGIVALSHSRHWTRARRRAAACGVPGLLLGGGLLRAPPAWGGGAQMLTATAHEMIGPNSPADFLDSGRLLLTRGWESSKLLVRATAARREIVSRRLSGAWWNAAADLGLPRSNGLVLIIAGETGGFADRPPSPRVLGTMLAVALAEHSPRQIVILAAAGTAGQFRRLSSFLMDAVARGCTVVTQAINPWEAIDRGEYVYTAGGETGFLALLTGATIRCFADSFYSGWGITADEPWVCQKPFRRTVDEVFAGACLLSTRCLDPYHMRAASFEDTLKLLGEWRNIDAANRRIAACVGMSFWKRRQVADFLKSSSGAPVFRRTTRAALATTCTRPGSAVAVWASRIPAGLAAAARAHGTPLVRVEDGFVRSVGLGSDFTPAASLILDSRGMHFDPGVRSDLEHLLIETEFDEALLERARALAAQLVARGITKYNLGTAALSIEWPAGKRRILVPGQVEDDLSVRLGGNGIAGNLDLLARVREANPEDFIIYKPHPDVEAGHRRGRVPDEVACGLADRVIRDVSTAALLAEIDELHTLTSLAGFEALLRGRRVVVYGRPFYAGWGLTTDLAKVERGRQLSIEELVAGALILYPRYLDPVSRLPCGPELVIERLEDPELWRPGVLVLARRLQGLVGRRWSEHSGKSSAVLPALSRPLRRNEPGARQV
jgi:capsular polysaccharide export protein